MPPPQGKISQKDFANIMRQEIPELKEFSDDEITKKMISLRPEWQSRIYTPDMAAADEQSKLQTRSHSIVDPETWKNHPMLGAIAKSITGGWPLVGGVLGGAAATPETLGLGTIGGAMAGAGAGSGLKNIANQALGLEDTSTLQKAGDIVLDAGLAGVAGGTAAYPKQVAKIAAGAAAAKLAPRAIRHILPYMWD